MAWRRWPRKPSCAPRWRYVRLAAPLRMRWPRAEARSASRWIRATFDSTSRRSRRCPRGARRCSEAHSLRRIFPRRRCARRVRRSCGRSRRPTGRAPSRNRHAQCGIIRAGKRGPARVGTPASLAQFFSGDARAFYRAYYRRGGALVSAAGKARRARAGCRSPRWLRALPDGTTSPVPVHVPPLQRSDARDRRASRHRLALADRAVSRANVNSRDFGPMLVLAAFVRRTLSDIAQVPGVVSPTFASRSVGTVYAYDRAPASWCCT